MSTRKVIGIAAQCRLERGRFHEDPPVSVRIREFLVFDDRQRIELRHDRGVSISPVIGGGRPREAEPFRGLGESALLELIASVLVPDEGDTQDEGEDFEWHEYSALAADRGIQVLPRELRALGVTIEFDEPLRRLVTDEGDVGS